MSLGTVLTYNGMTFSDVLTHSFNQEPIWTDDGVDYLYTQFTIDITAIINTSLLPASNYPTAADAIKQIHRCLMQPRKPLTFKIDTVTVLSSPPTGKRNDDKFGPQPQFFDVQEINGLTTFVCRFKIITWLFNCCSASTAAPDTPPPLFLANRWEQTAVIDRDMYTVRTTTGKLVISGRDNQNPDEDVFRNAVLPQIPKGFEREKSEYKLTSDNLSLAYQFVDRQVLHTPPKGCTHFEGSFAITTNDAVRVFQECSAKVWGNANAKKADLYKAATNIVIQALVGKGGIGNVKNITFAGGFMKHELHENIVEVRMRQMLSDGKARFFNLVKPDGEADQVYGCDQGSPDPGIRGTAMLKMAVAAFNDPCLQAALNANGGIGGNAAKAEGKAAKIVVVDGQLPVVPDDIVLNQVLTGIYSEYLQHISYVIDYNKLHMPLVGSTLSTFATVAKPKVTKIVTFYAQKYNEKPTLPDPNPTDPNEVLIDIQMGNESPNLGPNADSPVYTCSGRYVYGLRDSAKFLDGKNYKLGQYVYIQSSASDHALIPPDFQAGLHG